MAGNWLDNLNKLAGELREDLTRGGKLVLIGADGPIGGSETRAGSWCRGG